MNKDQITTISREYAEEKCGKENESPMYYAIAEEEMKEKLRWLSTRFCLVKKSEIQNWFQSRKKSLAHRNNFDVYLVREAEVEIKVLRFLFPEIAKEVEG